MDVSNIEKAPTAGRASIFSQALFFIHLSCARVAAVNITTSEREQCVGNYSHYMSKTFHPIHSGLLEGVNGVQRDGYFIASATNA
jgi:hypothetical protein